MCITKIFFIVVTIALVAENLSGTMFSSSQYGHSNPIPIELTDSVDVSSKESDSQNLPISSILINENHLMSEAPELSTAICRREFAVICAQRIFRDNTQLNEIQKNNLFQSLKDQVGKMSNEWCLLVFSEHFFFRTPVDNDYVSDVIKRCQALTNQYPKLIIHVNFLHEFSINNVPSHLSNNNYYSTDPNGKHITYGVSPNELFPNDPLLQKHIANYSLVFYKGQVISIYRKGTYFREADALISGGQYCYEFGNWKDNILNNGNPVEALFGQRLLVTRICADANKFLQPPPPAPILGENGVLIVPANDKGPSSIKSLLQGSQIAVFVDTSRGVAIITPLSVVVMTPGKNTILSEITDDYMLLACKNVNNILSSKSEEEGRQILEVDGAGEGCCSRFLHCLCPSCF